MILENPSAFGRGVCGQHNGGRGCRYFEWYDPPMCARAKIIIPWLLRRVESLEEVNKGLTVCIKKLRLMLVVAVMLVVWLVFSGIRSYFTGNNVEDPNMEYYNS